MSFDVVIVTAIPSKHAEEELERQEAAYRLSVERGHRSAQEVWRAQQKKSVAKSGAVDSSMARGSDDDSSDSEDEPLFLPSARPKVYRQRTVSAHHSHQLVVPELRDTRLLYICARLKWVPSQVKQSQEWAGGSVAWREDCDRRQEQKVRNSDAPPVLLACCEGSFYLCHHPMGPFTQPQNSNTKVGPIG